MLCHVLCWFSGEVSYSVLLFIHMSSGFKETLHGTCIGTVKKIVTMWLCTVREPHYIGNKVDTIDTRLTQISPPMAMRRYRLRIEALQR